MWRRTKSSDDMGTALESGGSSPSEPTAIEDAEGTENTAASPGIQTESEEVRPAGRVSSHKTVSFGLISRLPARSSTPTVTMQPKTTQAGTSVLPEVTLPRLSFA